MGGSRSGTTTAPRRGDVTRDYPPQRRRMGQPADIGSGDGEAIEGVAYGFADHFHAIERAHGGEYVRRVGALPPSCFEQLSRARPRQHHIEEQSLCLACSETSAELA